MGRREAVSGATRALRCRVCSFRLSTWILQCRKVVNCRLTRGDAKMQSRPNPTSWNLNAALMPSAA
eukprot:5949656-Prymnesium_polylepis.1